MLAHLIINDRNYYWDVSPEDTLAFSLRSNGFTSIRCGCKAGACGMCTVWLEGRPVLSCSLLTCRLDGAHVTTLEGLQEEARELSRHIVNAGADQCGFCAPGFVMAILAMKREFQAPFTLEQVREYNRGNICRCSGYQNKLIAATNYLNRDFPELELEIQN